MRKLACFAFAFSAAIFLQQYWLGEGAALCLAGLCLVGGLLLFLLRKPWAVAGRLLALGCLLGLGWSLVFGRLILAPAASLSGYEGEVTVLVTEYPSPSAYGKKLTGQLLREDGPAIGVQLYLPYGDDGAELEPGDQLRLEARLLLASDKTENDTFASKGTPLFAYSRSNYERVGKAAYAGLRFFPQRLAYTIRGKIREIFPADAVPFMLAILTGDRTELNAELTLYSAMKRTGTAHIVAVSGMHVVFLVSLLRLLLGRKRLGALLSIPLVLLFMAVTGFAPSVVRAGVMQILLLMASLLRREYDELTALSLALLLLLAINPVSVKNAGLQLSFAATLGLILYGRRLNAALWAPFSAEGRFARCGRAPILGRLLRFLCATVAATCGALLFSLPLSALYFGSVSLLSPVTNLIVLPLATLIFSFGVVCTVVGFLFLPLASFLAAVPGALVWLLRWFCLVLSILPFAAAYTESVYVRVWLGFLYLELLALLLIPAQKGKIRLFVCSNLLVLSCALTLTALQGREGRLRGTVLDVGQGQSVLLYSDGATALVDCGGSLGTDSGDIAADKLASLWLGNLDYLILTHFHADHANGVKELLSRVPVGVLLCPEPQAEDESGMELLDYARELGVPVEYREGSAAEYPLGAATVTLIPPLVSGEANERGLTILCSCDDFDVLITGDMDAETEQRLLETAELPDVEVFVAGHHGSAGSNSASLLDYTAPDTVIVSVGSNNPYGHPAQEALRRFAAAGATVFRTDQSGDITFIYQGEGLVTLPSE